MALLLVVTHDVAVVASALGSTESIHFHGIRVMTLGAVVAALSKLKGGRGIGLVTSVVQHRFFHVFVGVGLTPTGETEVLM